MCGFVIDQRGASRIAELDRPGPPFAMGIVERRSRLLFLAFLSLLFPILAHGFSEAPLAPVELGESWKFHPGNDPQWSDPGFDDSEWSGIEVPGTWTQQGYPEIEEGWYRITVPIPEEMSGPDGHLAVWIGSVLTSYEIYAGGEKLGGEGRLGQNPKVQYGRNRIFAIPVQAIGPSGHMTLALRVQRVPASGFGGFVGSPPKLGRLDDLARADLRADGPKLAIAVLFWVLGIYYLFFVGLLRSSRDHAWFGAWTLAQGLFTFLTSQWAYSLQTTWPWLSFPILKNIEYGARFLLPALAIEFFWPFLGVRISRWLRTYQGIHVAMAVIALATPGLRFELSSVRIWELFTLPLIVGIMVMIGLKAWQGNKEARTVLMGVLASGLAFSVDIASGRGWLEVPSLGLFAFTILVSSVAISINRRFARAHDDLDELRRTLETRVSERTAELSVAKRRAEAASFTKTELMASVSHEIRTPMMGVLGVGDLLLGTRLDAKQQRYVETVQSSARALLGVVDEILEYSRMETGRLEIRPEPFEVRRLVQDVVDLLEPRARQKSLGFEVTVFDDVPSFVEGDLWRLRQVLINLVGNAIKYTIEGEVALEVLPSRQRRGSPDLYLRFNVRDTGIGVAEGDMPKLFDAFMRVETTAEQRFEGTGLGLAISRRIVEAMGGQIGADSQVGHGSSFWFEIPTRMIDPSSLSSEQPALVEGPAEKPTVDVGKLDEPPVADGVPEPSEVVPPETSPEEEPAELETSELDIAAGGIASSAADTATPSTAHSGPTEKIDTSKIEIFGASRLVAGASEGLKSRRRARVLLAEDNPLNRLVLLGQLESLGVTAETVENGRMAVDRVVSEPFDLLLMDCQMPELDGYGASREIRTHEALTGLPGREKVEASEPGSQPDSDQPGRLPIVAVTAHAMTGERERCLESGMDDYLVKPFQLEQLEEVLLRWLPRVPEAAQQIVTPSESGVGQDSAE